MSNKYRKVDNGIIISSNIYSSFQTMTEETPTALMRVRGEKLIERQIKFLIDAGVEDITVVVGEGVDDFEYLVEKFNVDLVHMVENLKGTLAPLYYVRDRLKNTYILNGNDYLDKNLYDGEEDESWHCIIKTEKYTQEKAAKLDEDFRIVKLKNGGYKCNFLYGPAFINEDMSKKLKILLEEYYRDESRRNLDWQDILLDNIEDFKMYGYVNEYETVYTFDSMDELQRLDIDYKEDKVRLVDMISNIFGVNDDEISNVVEMGHGMTNDSMLFEFDGREHIIRVPGMGTDNLIIRRNEYINYDTVKDLDISDRVVYMNNETGVKITEFESGSRILRLDSEKEIKQAFSIMRKLHNSGLKVPHKFGLNDRIWYYETLCKEQGVKFLDGYEEVRARIKGYMKSLSKLNIPSVFCHIDPVDENFLVLEDGGMILIDWEYSSMADPLIDLAMFSVHGGLEKDNVDKIMEIYFERKPTEEERLRVYDYISMCGFLWYLWSEYKEALGEDFTEYKLRMFDIAQNFCKEVPKL